MESTLDSSRVLNFFTEAASTALIHIYPLTIRQLFHLHLISHFFFKLDFFVCLFLLQYFHKVLYAQIENSHENRWMETQLLVVHEQNWSTALSEKHALWSEHRHWPSVWASRTSNFMTLQSDWDQTNPISIQEQEI